MGTDVFAQAGRKQNRLVILVLISSARLMRVRLVLSCIQLKSRGSIWGLGDIHPAVVILQLAHELVVSSATRGPHIGSMVALKWHLLLLRPGTCTMDTA